MLKSEFIKGKGWKYLLVELFVVFTGIYSAFLVTIYQENQKEKENKIIYFETFVLQLNYFETETKRLKAEIANVREAISHNKEEGIPVNRKLKFTNNMFVLRSAYENENFSVIGSDFLNSISIGTDVILEINERLKIVRDETRSYNLKVDKLEEEKQKFRDWYLEELTHIEGLLDQHYLDVTEGALPATTRILEELRS